MVELADSLDSGSSAHYGRAGSSPASRTKSDTDFDTMGISLVSDFFAPWGGRFCMSRHSVFSHAVRWRSARDPGFHFFNQESRVRKVLETRRVRSLRKQKKKSRNLTVSGLLRVITQHYRFFEICFKKTSYDSKKNLMHRTHLSFDSSVVSETAPSSRSVTT